MRYFRFWFGVVVFVFFGNCFSRGSDFRLDLARRLASEGQYRSAVEEYKKYLGENPQSPEVYVELAEIRVDQGKYYLAIFNLKTALKQNPDYVEAQEALANTYEKSGKTEKAIMEWRKLATLSESEFLKNRAEKHIADLMNRVKAGEVTPLDEKKKKPSKTTRTKPKPKKASLKKQSDEDDTLSVEDLAGFADEDSVSPKPKKHVVEKTVSKKQTGGSKKVAPNSEIYSQKNFKKAVSLINAKKYDSGLKEIRTCLLKVPGHPGAYYYGGIARYNKNQYKKAIINFKKGLRYPELGFNGHFYLGKIYAKQNQNKSAIKHLNLYIKRTKKASGRAEAEKMISRLSGKSSSSEPVKTPDTKKLQPEKPGARLSLKTKNIGNRLHLIFPDSETETAASLKNAVAFYSEKKPEHAINALKEIILNQSGSVYSKLASLDLAVVYLRLGLFKNAQNYSEDFLEGGKSHTTKEYGKYIHARALLGKKQSEAALNELSSITPDSKLGPSSKDIHSAIAEAYQQQGNFEKAVSFLKKMQSKTAEKEERLKLSLKLSSMYQKQGALKKSIHQLTNVIKDCSSKNPQPLCPDARVQLGDLNYQLSKLKQALRHYRQAVSRFPTHKLAPWCLYQIGNIHKRRGELKLAMDHYRDVIEQFPDSYWATQAKWKKDDAVWQNEYREVFD